MSVVTTQQLAGTLHLLLCNRPHCERPEDLINEGRDPEVCYYNVEEQLDERWEMPDHIRYEKIAHKLARVSGQGPGGILTTVADIIKYTRAISEIVENAPCYKHVVRAVLLSRPNIVELLLSAPSPSDSHQ